MRSAILSIIICFSLKQSQAQEWKPFTDTAGYYTATYPETWTQKIKEGNRVFFTSPLETDNDAFRQNVNISTTVSGEFNGEKIKELAPDLVKSLETSYEEYTFIGSRYFTWNGIESYEIIYSFKPKGLDYLVRTKQWLSIKKDVLYVATYTAPNETDAFAETAIRILNGIRF